MPRSPAIAVSLAMTSVKRFNEFVLILKISEFSVISAVKYLVHFVGTTEYFSFRLSSTSKTVASVVSFAPSELDVIGFTLHRLEIGSNQPVRLEVVLQIIF